MGSTASFNLMPRHAQDADFPEKLNTFFSLHRGRHYAPLTAKGIYHDGASRGPFHDFLTEKSWWKPAAGAPSAKSLLWQPNEGKSYIVPALEIPAFLVVLNLYNRVVAPDEEEKGEKTYSTNFSSVWKNISDGRWVVDHDPFYINQFAHPYQGTMHYGFARSTGLNFWESLLYANVGSFLWELGGETTPPSINDQIATGTGGSLMGEALFRTASLILEGVEGKPGFWRELGAAALSPATGINRFVFGNRFKSVFPGHHPAYFWFLQLGAGINTNLDNSDNLPYVNRCEAIVNFAMTYGLPGKPGYSYKRPFDYFNAEVTGRSNSKYPLESISIRGLLLGTDYALGDSYDGIWGFYGGYDYVSAHLSPVSSTSVSFGTTFQWWLFQAIALQGSVTGGVGYAAGGTAAEADNREYHYGITPQGLLALRLIFGDRAMLDITGRTYYLLDTGGDEKKREQLANYLNASLTVRVYDRHALALQYLGSVLDERYPDSPDAHQTRGTFGLFYTWLGDTRFGVVD